MSKEREALKLALEALEIEQAALAYEHGKVEHIENAITTIKEALAQPEQEPVAFPRQAGKSTWTVDTAFIWRVKHTIDPDTPNDFTPSEEQIETVLLALEKIPSNLYTTPPQRKPLPHSVMVKHMKESCDSMEMRGAFADGWMSAEAAHGIKE